MDLLNRLSKLCSCEIRDKKMEMSHTNIRIEPVRLNNIWLVIHAVCGSVILHRLATGYLFHTW